MKNGIRVAYRQRRRWSLAARSFTALVAATGLSLVLAACGGPSQVGVAQLGATTTQPGTSTNPSSSSGLVAAALVFAQCMRSHGVTNFPDPDASGDFNKVAMNHLSTSNPRYPHATQSCAHLLPGIGGMTPALAQEIANDEAKFVTCMRSHGVPNWPNPVLDQGRLVFDPQAVGIDPTTPRIETKLQACDYVFPASVGVPPGAGHNS